MYRLLEGLIIRLCVLITIACSNNTKHLLTGAEQVEKYSPLLKNKRIGLVMNHASLVKEEPLWKVLQAENLLIQKIFTPEHGLQNAEEAGEVAMPNIHSVLNIPVVSLYEKNYFNKQKRPCPELLHHFEDIDVVLFDLQDVGVRCFTYVTILQIVMEICAKIQKKLIILDRPNPNGYYIDGPILDKGEESFVGVHPIPLVYGLTIGELAKMINEEGWLKDEMVCDLEIITLKGYYHKDSYNIPVTSSPNLQNAHAVLLYPSLVLFEGTVISLARERDMSFEGIELLKKLYRDFPFISHFIPGNSLHSLYEEEVYYRYNLQKRKIAKKRLILDYLVKAYHVYPNKKQFFTPFFSNIGGKALQEDIQKGHGVKKIRKKWERDSKRKAYEKKREKYLLYP